MEKNDVYGEMTLSQPLVAGALIEQGYGLPGIADGRQHAAVRTDRQAERADIAGADRCLLDLAAHIHCAAGRVGGGADETSNARVDDHERSPVWRWP